MQNKYNDKHVIFCEGSTDVDFFKTLFSKKIDVKKIDLEKNVTLTFDAEFVDGGGGANISNRIVEELLLTLGQEIPRSITVIVDGDDKLEEVTKRFKKTFNTSKNYRLNPENQMTWDGTFNQYNPYVIKKGEWISQEVKMGIFTVQGADFKDLETLCLKIATHLPNPKYQAVLAGFEENCNNLPKQPKSLDKAKAQVYLASMEQWCDCKFSAGLNKGYLDSNHEALAFLDPILSVLRSDFPAN